MHRITAAVVCVVAGVAVGQPVVESPSSVPSSPLAGFPYDAAFFPNANHDPAVPTPDSVLGFVLGSKPATHAQIEAVIKAIAQKSPRCRLMSYAVSHEGRTLYNLVIGREDRIKDLDQLKKDWNRLADPRLGPAGDVDGLVKTTPALAWMMYVIHGDEMSGADAALAAAWHLASSTDEDVKTLLDEIVIVIDPLMNPDGRDRFISQIAQNRPVQPNFDDQSLIHTGFWPRGRMNHYLFDMNRDWIFATQPETRGRIKSVNEWKPHFLLESHEMGPQDTFLFSPAREPTNPNMPGNYSKWIDSFAADTASAFDSKGWKYYTGEWNEEWYPGYSGSWAGMRNIIGMLYEQASFGTDGVRKQSGVIETYREAVHHQLVATISNLRTLAANREKILTDYVAERRRNVANLGPKATEKAAEKTAEKTGEWRTFAVLPGPNTGRLNQFLDLMNVQGIEVYELDKEAKYFGKDRLGRAFEGRTLPVGTLLIPERQPESRLVAAMLEFDPRIPDDFLLHERQELLRFGQSKLYDITGWNISMMFDVEALELKGDVAEGTPRARTLTPAPVFPKIEPKQGWLIPGDDDRSVAAAARLMERGVRVRVADKPFAFGGKDAPRGSLVITRADNQGLDLPNRVAAVLEPLGVAASPINSGMSPGDLPDIGGAHFVLLEQPRIAVVGREPFDPYSFGESWHTIDRVLGVRATYIDAASVSASDLRRYNVLILPNGGAGWVKDNGEAIKAWITDGGTLIAIGGTAGALAKDASIVGSKARTLDQVLTKPDDYRLQIVREWEGRRTTIDPAAVWSQSPPAEVVYPWVMSDDAKASDDEIKRRDAWRQIFMPPGVLVAGRVDDRSWLTSGLGEYVPVSFGGDTILMTPAGVQAPVRLGVFLEKPPEPAKNEVKKDEAKPEDSKDAKKEDKPEEKKDKPKPGWSIAPPGHELRLRLSGLLWPEAADRIANAAYVTREQVGAGQVILFANSPTFRAATLGTGRVFQNAVVFGPGMGAYPAIRP